MTADWRRYLVTKEERDTQMQDAQVQERRALHSLNEANHQLSLIRQKVTLGAAATYDTKKDRISPYDWPTSEQMLEACRRVHQLELAVDDARKRLDNLARIEVEG